MLSVNELIALFKSQKVDENNCTLAKKFNWKKKHTYNKIYWCVYPGCLNIDKHKLARSWYEATCHLYQHIGKVQLKNKQCGACGKTIETYEKAAIHIIQKHIQMFYACKHCGKRSKTLINHNSHMIKKWNCRYNLLHKPHQRIIYEEDSDDY